MALLLHSAIGTDTQAGGLFNKVMRDALRLAADTAYLLALSIHRRPSVIFVPDTAAHTLAPAPMMTKNLT